MKSIISLSDNCFLCGRIATEWHHIFGGSNRKHSEKYGLKIHLCSECHRTSERSVHRSKKVSTVVKEIAQKAFEKEHTRTEFMQIFGRNYL